MHRVTFSMTQSLDGFVLDEDGGIDWSAPSAEVFRFHIERVSDVGVHLLGRRLHETMLYWEDPDVVAGFDEDERAWADLWNPIPKVVFSRTLTSVAAPARLATGTLAEEIARLRAEPGDGEIAVGGASLAAQAAEQGLIDEYQVFTAPVLLGGGTPFFARGLGKVDLELVESRTFESGMVFGRYRVVA